jgi:hypothetical protein
MFLWPSERTLHGGAYGRAGTERATRLVLPFPCSGATAGAVRAAAAAAVDQQSLRGGHNGIAKFNGTPQNPEPR